MFCRDRSQARRRGTMPALAGVVLMMLVAPVALSAQQPAAAVSDSSAKDTTKTATDSTQAAPAAPMDCKKVNEIVQQAVSKNMDKGHARVDIAALPGITSADFYRCMSFKPVPKGQEPQQGQQAKPGN